MTRTAMIALHRAFDEAKFGPARTLDVRTGLPSVAEALRRAEPWMRERQMARAGDVLVITGRGKGSPGGAGLIRLAMQRLFGALKRQGVIGAVREHTEGSFVVTLAPVRALFEVAPRSRRRGSTIAMDPTALTALEPGTRASFRRLAELSLDTLGAPRTEEYVQDEMVRQFAILAAALAPDERDHEARLQSLLQVAIDAYIDDR